MAILSLPIMRPLSLIAALFVEHINGLEQGYLFFARGVDGEIDIHDVEADLFDTSWRVLMIAFLAAGGQ